MTTVSLRFEALGQVHVAFGRVDLFPGYGSHRLAFHVEVTGTWLKPDEPTSTAAALVTGTLWTDLPTFRWVSGLEPHKILKQKVTGGKSGKEHGPPGHSV